MGAEEEFSKEERLEMRRKLRAEAKMKGGPPQVITEADVIAALKAQRGEEGGEGAPAGDILAEHTVGPGDSLSTIAKKYYGDAYQYPKIYEFNKEVIGDDPNLIVDGTVLKIPKLPDEEK
jgi:nucleoid-associated protein YgaU